LRKLAYALIVIIVIGLTAWSLVTYNSLLQNRSELSQVRRDVVVLETNLQETPSRLARTSNDLTSTQQELASVRQELSSAQRDIASLESKLELYKDTWGSVVASGVQPPFFGADIVSYETSRNPTWAQLLDFLQRDTTDRNAYVTGVYMCGDFARDVHNNAERAGIRAAYVAVKLPSGYHALNAFKTTDRGLVFIDCTGLQASQSGPSSRDKMVSVKLGRSYIPKSLFPESGWSTTWESLGSILAVQMYW